MNLEKQSQLYLTLKTGSVIIVVVSEIGFFSVASQASLKFAEICLPLPEKIF